ncbi:MAG: GldG family protein [Candidatus Sumerlaeia bacterium]
MVRFVHFLIKSLPFIGAALIVGAVVVAIVSGQMGQASLAMVGLGLLFFMGMFLKFDAGSIRFMGNMSILALLLAANLTVLYLLVLNHDGQRDLTKGGRLSLSPQTRKVLQNLKRPVQVSVLAMQNEPFDSYLRKYAQLNDKFTYEISNPYQRTLFSTKPGQELELNQIMVRSGDKEETLKLGAQSRDELDRIERKLERMLLNAILKVSRDHKLRVYFTKGHGEKTLQSLGEGPTAMRSISKFGQILRDNGMELRETNLRNDRLVPEDCDALLMVGPRRDYLEIEIRAINEYLLNGGRLLALIDPKTENDMDLTRLRQYFAEWGVGVSQDIVVDTGSYDTSRNQFVPLVQRFNPSHAITQSLQGMGESLPLVVAAGVFKLPDAPESIERVELLYSSDRSWLIDYPAYTQVARDRSIKPSDQQSVLPLGIAVEPTSQQAAAMEKAPRMVILGDSDFLTDPQLGQVQLSLGYLMVSWLAEQEDVMDIPPRDIEQQPLILNPRQRDIIAVLCVVVAPVVLLFGGLTYTNLRRRRR